MNSSLSEPSTIFPSIFSFAATGLSQDDASLTNTLSEHEHKNLNEEPTQRHLRKRKREKEVYESTGKRRRLNGRPKNEWTPTRLRKLVRLYLMTDLDIIDIAKVLHAEGFNPCKRNVQEQLKNFLQPRPDKIRLKGSLKRGRLSQLLQCRNLRKAEGNNNLSSRGLEAPPVTNNTCDTVDEEELEDRASATNTDKDGRPPWIESPSAVNNLKSLACGKTWTRLCGTGESTTGICSTNITSGVGMGERSIEGSFEHLPVSSSRFGSWQSDSWPQSSSEQNAEFDFPFGASGASQDAMHIGSSFPKITSISATTNPITVDYWNPNSAPHGQRLNAGAYLAVNQLFFLEDEVERQDLDAQSISSTEEMSCRSSILDFESIHEKLPFVQSRSRIQDISSILEGLSLSGSSDHSSGGILADAKSSPFSIAQLSNILSRARPGYCWESISSLAMSCTDQGLNQKKQIGQPGHNNISTELRVNVLSSIVFDKVRKKQVHDKDKFGNSILHLLASFPARSQEFLTLISLGVDLNSQNNAGQTFLHLISHRDIQTYDICFLLQLAKDHGFDFTRRDHLGQSVLHLLTRPSAPQNIIDTIIIALYSMGIDTTPSRDCLGHTVVEQLNDFGNRALDFDSAREVGLLGLTRETMGKRIVNQTSFKINRGEVNSSIRDDISAQKLVKNDAIESLADLNYYTYHADLLRLIVQAMSIPLLEDSEGRNALHCLAEVSLEQPAHLKPSPKGAATGLKPARERYLIDLLEVGADPNHYDKWGQTPLMAFITHLRADEHDQLTTQLLTELVKANANIHWRNRNGETALHIAVKLGRRVATKFLLQEKPMSMRGRVMAWAF